MFDRDDVPHFLAEEVAPQVAGIKIWGPQLMLVGELLTHFLGSLHQGFETCVRELDDEQIHWRHSDDTVSIAFHTWHAVRTKDNIINFVCQDRKKPVWLRQGLDEAWGLPRVDQGTGMSDEQALQLRVPGVEALLQYAQDVHDDVIPYVRDSGEAELASTVRGGAVRPSGEVAADHADLHRARKHAPRHGRHDARVVGHPQPRLLASSDREQVMKVSDTVRIVPVPEDEPMRPTQTNIYIVGQPGGQVLTIDSGEAIDKFWWMLRGYLAAIDQSEIGIAAISHHHFDHSGNLKNVHEHLKAEVAVPENGVKLLRGRLPKEGVRTFVDGQTLNLDGGVRIQVIATPGHSVDSLCYYIEEDGRPLPRRHGVGQHGPRS